MGVWYHGVMSQQEAQEQLKELEAALEGLEKEAKAAIGFAIDAISAGEVEEIRRKIAALEA